MESLEKAFIMAAQILMFIVALSISIYLYSKLIYNVDQFMLASDYSNRGDSIVGNDTTVTMRDATKAEIIMAILDLKDKYKKTEDSSYEVHVNGTVYSYYPSGDEIDINGTKVGFNTWELRNTYFADSQISNSLYELKYSESSKILIYTEK